MGSADDSSRHRLTALLRFTLALGLVLSLAGVPWSPLASLWFVALLAVHLADMSGSGWRRCHEWLRVHGFAVGLGAIMLTSLCLRLLGAWTDLGHTPVDVDEHRLATAVLGFFKTGEIDHSTVESYPGPLYWLLVASYLLVYLGALTQGVADNLNSMPVELFVAAGRVTNDLLTVGTVLFTGLLGARLGGRLAGLGAALVVAVAPLSMEVSGQLRNEAAQALLVVAAVWVSVMLAGEGASDAPIEGGGRRVRRDSMLALAAGGLAGAATAVKYSSVFALLPALLASIQPALAAEARSARRSLGRIGFALFAFLVVLALTNHFLWADFPNFIRELALEVRMSGAHHWSAQQNPRWYYTRILGTIGPGWTFCVLAGCYAVWGLATRRADALIVLAFPLSYVAFMTQRPAQFPRWIYPLVPFVAVAGAAAPFLVIERMRDSGLAVRSTPTSTTASLTASLLLVIALTQPLWRSGIVVRRRLAAPTHALAEAWLREHASRGDRILAGVGWLDLKGSGFLVNRVSSLQPILGGGVYLLCYNDWVVVPKPDINRVDALRRLRLAASFRQQNSASGNFGYDFDIYATPHQQPTAQSIAFALDRDDARSYLASDWPAAEVGREGRPLPHEGASVFLPPLEGPASRVEIQLEVERDPHAPTATMASGSSEMPITVNLDQQPLQVDKLSRQGARLSWSSVPIPTERVGRRVFAVRITPVGESTVRILRFAVRR